MFRKTSPYSYQINLPPYAAKEIIEWFETARANGTLSEEIIGMVFESLSFGSLNDNKSAMQPMSQVTETTTSPPEINSKVSQLTESSRTVETPAAPIASIETPDISSKETTNFLDSLYDWEGANSAVTNEEIPILPASGKKRMLLV